MFGMALPSADRWASMPNFSASRTVWWLTASGVRMIAGFPVFLATFSAHASCVGVLPSPI
jgi:hypothetical protein